MHVLITSPRGKRDEYDVRAISGMNADGAFSILPSHARFISLIEGDIFLYPDSIAGEKPQPIKVKVGTGVIRCFREQVEVYTDLVNNPELIEHIRQRKRLEAEAAKVRKS